MTELCPRAVIAGTGSGSGKTTVMLALLGALQNQSLQVSAFKCGPDYIDPMFHRRVLGTATSNLDLFFLSEKQVRAQFLASAGNVNLIEGVMGLYDGQSMDTCQGSTWHMAKVLDAPVLLVTDARGKALSLAAEINGFRHFRENSRIAGLLLNRAGSGSYLRLQAMLEKECGIPVLGYLPQDPAFMIPSRHLGLVTAAEIEDLQEKMQALATRAAKTMDLPAILSIMNGVSPITGCIPAEQSLGYVRLAVAWDDAFCFYYQEDLLLLQALGATLIPFSPLRDPVLPECDGLLLGGGYPELYLEGLHANTAMRHSIRRQVENGLPTLAECGGFMYLCRSIDDVPMCSVIDTACKKTDRLVRFGYCQLSAHKNTMLLGSGESVKGHEFHRWEADNPGTAYTAVRTDGQQHLSGYATDTLYAGFVHLSLVSQRNCARRFIEACLARGNHDTTGN